MLTGLEEDRLTHLRDSLWRVANINSLAAVADDLAAEEVRKSLETCDLDNALVNFIEDNSTGSVRYNDIVIVNPEPEVSSM